MTISTNSFMHLINQLYTSVPIFQELNKQCLQCGSLCCTMPVRLSRYINFSLHADAFLTPCVQPDYFGRHISRLGKVDFGTECVSVDLRAHCGGSVHPILGIVAPQFPAKA